MPRCLLAIVLLMGLHGPASAAGIQAGAFAQDVTPTWFPVSVNGSMRDVKAQGATDRIHARCLVLKDDATTIALVVVDSCMLPRELLDDAKAQASKLTGIPSDHMMISATHTHSAPTSTGVFQSDVEPDYPAFLAARIAEGISKARARFAPAQLAWVVGREPNQVFNRRWYMKPGTIQADPFGQTTDQVKMNPGYQNPDLVKPAGPTDPEVSVLSVRSLEGRPIALLANYSLHYVGGIPALSADYFGAFAEQIGTMLKADRDFVGILSNGTSGDVNNINFGGPAPQGVRPGERARIVAMAVARAAFVALDHAEYTSDVTLAAAEREIELGVRKPTPADLKRAQEIMAAAKEAGKEVLTTTAEIYARESLLLAKYPDRVKLKLQAYRIGKLGLATIPCEVFTEIGLAIKAASPLKPTFTVSLANGYNGYLPTPAQHELGGYETWRARSSYLETKASDQILATLKELLADVSK